MAEPSPRLHITPYGASGKPLHPMIDAARVHIQVVDPFGRHRAYDLRATRDGLTLTPKDETGRGG